MRGLLKWGLGVILLGLASCYKVPNDLRIPTKYNSGADSPYVMERDEEEDINYYTLKNTQCLIEKARRRVPALVRVVEESEGDRNKTLNIILLKNKAYMIVGKKFEVEGVRTKNTVGLYSPFYGSIILKGWNPKTMVHELIHFIDYQDGEEDLSEKDVERKEREIWEKFRLN